MIDGDPSTGVYSLEHGWRVRARTPRSWVWLPDGPRFPWVWDAGEIFIGDDAFEVVVVVPYRALVQWDPDGSLRVNKVVVAPVEILRIENANARRVAWATYTDQRSVLGFQRHELDY